MRPVDRPAPGLHLRGAPHATAGTALAVVLGAAMVGVPIVLAATGVAGPLGTTTKVFGTLVVVAGAIVLPAALWMLTVREALHLDRDAGRGTYRKWSTLTGGGGVTPFTLAGARVRVERAQVAVGQPRNAGAGVREQFAAVLSVPEPAGVIELATGHGDGAERVRAVAEAVAGHLGVPCEDSSTD